MENDFFTFSRKEIEKDNEAGRCNAAHSRKVTLSCLAKFLGKEYLPFNELSPDLMTQFEEWLAANGRKESTVRFYLNQINALYNVAAHERLVPEMRLLKDVKATIPVGKQERELLTESELRRMRYADLSDSKPMTFARDMFFFSIYGRGISFTDIAHIKKNDVKGFTLTYTSQVIGQPRITVQWDAAMQDIADRYPSKTDYLFPFITSGNKVMASRDVKRVRENIVNAFKQIATRCSLSVVPSMYMVKDIYQRAIDGVSVSKII